MPDTGNTAGRSLAVEVSAEGKTQGPKTPQDQLCVLEPEHVDEIRKLLAAYSIDNIKVLCDTGKEVDASSYPQFTPSQKPAAEKTPLPPK